MDEVEDNQEVENNQEVEDNQEVLIDEDGQFYS
jgi:hypothetical protein